MRAIFRGPRGLLVGGAILAAIAILVLMVGGDEGSEPAPSEQSAAINPPSEQSEPSGGGPKSAPDETQAAPEAGGSSDPEDNKLTREEISEEAQKIPVQQRQQFAQTAVQNVLQSFGFPRATARLARNGEVVVITVPAPDACAVDLSRLAELKRALLRIIIFARAVRISVLGYGRLVHYIRAHCAPLEMPSAPGRVVLSESGTGVRGFEEFEITANRFTVAFTNSSGNLKIYVTKAKELMEPVIESEKREAGSRTYPGPGVYRVTVTGSGNWAVRVYDGA